MDNTSEHNTDVKRSKVPPAIWLCSWLIAAFYLLSALGWYRTVYMVHTGLLGEEVMEYANNFTVLDHTIRHLTVVASIVGSVLLIFMRKTAFYIFPSILAVTIIGWVVNTDWVITFLSPVFLLPVCIYLYFVKDREYLKARIPTN